MYTFHKVQCHSRCPDLVGWYLQLDPGAYDTLNELHEGVTVRNWDKFGLDPHLRNTYNPIVLSAGWLTSVNKYLLAGETLLVNCAGGFMPMKGVKILDTVESEYINWLTRYTDETIRVARWPNGTHWHLSSNKNRVFNPAKYTRFDDAYAEAERYAPSERIQVQDRRYG